MLTGLLHKTLIFFKDDNRNHTHTHKNPSETITTQISCKARLKFCWKITWSRYLPWLFSEIIMIFQFERLTQHSILKLFIKSIAWKRFPSAYLPSFLSCANFLQFHHILIFCLICSSFAFAHLSPRILLVNLIYVSCPWHQRTAVNNVLNSLSWCGKIKAIF